MNIVQVSSIFNNLFYSGFYKGFRVYQHEKVEIEMNQMHSEMEIQMRSRAKVACGYEIGAPDLFLSFGSHVRVSDKLYCFKGWCG